MGATVVKAVGEAQVDMEKVEPMHAASILAVSESLKTAEQEAQAVLVAGAVMPETAAGGPTSFTLVFVMLASGS